MESGRKTPAVGGEAKKQPMSKRKKDGKKRCLVERSLLFVHSLAAAIGPAVGRSPGSVHKKRAPAVGGAAAGSSSHRAGPARAAARIVKEEMDSYYSYSASEHECPAVGAVAAPVESTPAVGGESPIAQTLGSANTIVPAVPGDRKVSEEEAARLRELEASQWRARAEREERQMREQIAERDRWRRQNPLTQARIMAPGPFWYSPPPCPPPFHVPVESLP